MSIEDAYLIDRINPTHTGVDVPLWISCEDSDRIPQVKAEADGISFAIAIDDQRFLSDDNDYLKISTSVLIQFKRQALLDYWKLRIDTASFLRLMIRLP